jgi:hypothetical protein
MDQVILGNGLKTCFINHGLLRHEGMIHIVLKRSVEIGIAQIIGHPGDDKGPSFPRELIRTGQEMARGAVGGCQSMPGVSLMGLF